MSGSRKSYYKAIKQPLVIAHRGSSAYRPESTLEAFTVAIEMGCDMIEPDLVATKDGHLVVRHENDISGTTDVGSRPEFASRKATKSVDDEILNGWFTEDFTLAELKSLRCIERLPKIRPENTKYDGLFQIPTFQEVIDLAKAKSKELGRTIGIIPEVKHPSYFRNLGLPTEESMIEILERNDWNNEQSPVVIQSFEISNLKELRQKTPLALMQLVNSADKQPFDWVLAGDKRTYADMVTKEGIKEMSTYADIIAPHKDWIIPVNASKEMLSPSDICKTAHEFNLMVSIWTLRPENEFLPKDFKRIPYEDSSIVGDLQGEITRFLDAGVDMFFTDAPDFGRRAVDKFTRQ